VLLSRTCVDVVVLLVARYSPQENASLICVFLSLYLLFAAQELSAVCVCDVRERLGSLNWRPRCVL